MLLWGILWPLSSDVGAVIPIPGGGGPTNILLNAWSFADTTNWLDYRGYGPVSYTNLSLSNLGDGTALVVDSPDPAWLLYNVTEADGSTNLAVQEGSVVFWFAPYWAGTSEGGTGPQDSARLLEVGNFTTNASYGWWSLYLDADGVQIHFAGQTNDGSGASYLSAPLAWTSNRWHLVALTYSATNSSLYLDGEFITNGLPVTYWPSPEVLTNGFYIGSDSSGGSQARGMFDGLRTYANVIDSGTVEAIFRYESVPYYLNPLNFANWGSAPSSPQVAPTFLAITGSGFLQELGTIANCVSSSNVWMTNVVSTVLTNNTVNLTFSVVGGSNSLAYDVFATAGLVGVTITNAQWAWMGQGYQCKRYTLTNLPSYSALLILGTPKDTDQDGLTDAYELLVSHTDPTKPDTSGDGMLDGWKVIWGLNPRANNTAQTSQRFNFSYDPAGWLKDLTGVRSESIGPDAEGNVTTQISP